MTGAVLSGAALGLALLSKYTALVLFPVIILTLLLFCIWRLLKQEKTSWTSILCGTLVVFIAAVLVVCAGHGFREVFQPLVDMKLHSGTMIAIKNSFLGLVPVPLPQLYIDAVDYLFLKKESYFDYYLMGETAKSGWPHYFLVATVLKYPLPLLLMIIAAVAHFFRAEGGFTERAMWLPVIAIYVLFSFAIKVDMGVRYLLPALPFFVLLAAGVFHRHFNATWKKAVLVILCLWYASSIFHSFGNGLAYFNELAGGPQGGHRYLAESNLDWGQNLVRLKRYVGKNPSRPLLVYNYGLAPASAYGMETGWIPCRKTRAVVAISVNYLYGIDPFQKRKKECFEWLMEYEPVAKLGGGLFVFDTRNDPMMPPPLPEL